MSKDKPPDSRREGEQKANVTTTTTTHTPQGSTKHTAKYGGEGINFGLPRFHKEIKIRPKPGLGEKRYHPPDTGRAFQAKVVFAMT